MIKCKAVYKHIDWKEVSEETLISASRESPLHRTIMPVHNPPWQVYMFLSAESSHYMNFTNHLD